MELKIINGKFYEGERVTVAIDGKVITRRVYYSRDAGDLYILYKGAAYFYSEFE